MTLLLSLAMVPLLQWGAQTAHAQSGPGVHALFDVGYRYPIIGQEYVPGHDAFPVTWHAGTSLFVGQQLGFYTGARFDGLGPRGSHFPFAASVRLGYFFDVHEYVPPRAHYSSSSRTDCQDAEGSEMWVECTTTTTTRQWHTPAHFVNGVRYVYAGYRHLGFLEGAPTGVGGTRPTTHAGAVALGIGFYGTKNTLAGVPYMTFLTEFEGWYHVWGLDEPSSERFRYGGSVRAAMILGPVFLDVTAAIDAAFGGEISVGGGVLLGS